MSIQKDIYYAKLTSAGSFSISKKVKKLPKSITSSSSGSRSRGCNLVSAFEGSFHLICIAWKCTVRYNRTRAHNFHTVGMTSRSQDNSMLASESPSGPGCEAANSGGGLWLNSFRKTLSVKNGFSPKVFYSVRKSHWRQLSPTGKTDDERILLWSIAVLPYASPPTHLRETQGLSGPRCVECDMIDVCCSSAPGARTSVLTLISPVVLCG